MQKPSGRADRPRRVLRWVTILLTGIALGGCDGVEPTAPGVAGPLSGPALHQGGSPHVDVYVHAHQDDWQIFMGDRAGASVQGAAEKVVLIHTTAGDGGRGSAFWQARESAGQASIDTLLPEGSWSCGQRTVMGHPIHRCTKGKVVSYYMRMPDGNWGEGFGYGSLQLLQQGQPTSAIDNSTTYATWTDFVETLREIIASEADGQVSPNVEISGPEYNRFINFGDHVDHLATADAVQAATLGRSWDLAWYVGYHTQELAENLSPEAHALKLGLFWKYTWVMGNAGYGSAWHEPLYQTWLSRTYARLEPYIPPSPPAAPTELQGSATHSRVTLVWVDNSADETAFRVERAPDIEGTPGAWTAVLTTSANATSGVDTTVTPLTGYWYRVRAEGNAGGSAYTEAVSVTTQPLPPPPEAPVGLQGVAASGSRIDLTWIDVASNETAYELERALDVGGAPGTYALIARLSPDATGFSDGGLQPNTSYWYRLRARNDGGESGAATGRFATSSAFEVDVYVQAYPDDWQLHMGDRVNASLGSAQRVVFLYTTAGDIGFGTQFWTTRENSSKASVDTLVGAGAWNCARRDMSGHPIQRCEKGKVVAYYMRMPDGFWGDGFGYGSLPLLKSGQPTSTIDNSTVYTSWADFTATVRAIISVETGGQQGPYAEINSFDYDRTLNPGDWPDRYATGDAVLAASQGQGWEMAWYVGRSVSGMAANVTGTPYQKKVEAFRAADQVMIRGGYGSTWWEVQEILPKTYYRTGAAQ